MTASEFTARDALAFGIAVFGGCFGITGGLFGGVVFGLWLARICGVEL